MEGDSRRRVVRRFPSLPLRQPLRLRSGISVRLRRLPPGRCAQRDRRSVPAQDTAGTTLSVVPAGAEYNSAFRGSSCLGPRRVGRCLRRSTSRPAQPPRHRLVGSYRRPGRAPPCRALGLFAVSVSVKVRADIVRPGLFRLLVSPPGQGNSSMPSRRSGTGRPAWGTDDPGQATATTLPIWMGEMAAASDSGSSSATEDSTGRLNLTTVPRPSLLLTSMAPSIPLTKA